MYGTHSRYMVVSNIFPLILHWSNIKNKFKKKRKRKERIYSILKASEVWGFLIRFEKGSR